MNQLYRSLQDRLFLGVCGGLAERYGWDPTCVRLACVLRVFAGAPGIVAYSVLALVMPRRQLPAAA
ncbi:MAG: PspC domain-containing protein [Nannocystales bacterium]